MAPQHPCMPRASAAELKALSAALQEGEAVCWAARQCAPPRWWTKMRLMLTGFALAIMGGGVGMGLASVEVPLTLRGWQHLHGLGLVEALVSLLFSLLPLLGGLVVGGGLLWFACSPEARRLCVLTNRRMLLLGGGGELTCYALRPNMGYQLCPEGAGCRGSLILHARAEMLSNPLGDCASHLPNVRAAEEALLAATRTEPVPEVEVPLLSRWVSGVTEGESCQVAATLCRGERLLWAERPVPAYFPWGEGQRFVFFCAFTLFALGMLGLFLWKGSLEPGAVVAAISILGFLALAGLFGMLRPLFRRRALGRSLYLITDRRALILEPDWRGDWQSFAYPLEPTLVKCCRKHADGGGDMLFSTAAEAADIDRGMRGFVCLRNLERTQRELIEVISNR